MSHRLLPHQLQLFALMLFRRLVLSWCGEALHLTFCLTTRRTRGTHESEAIRMLDLMNARAGVSRHASLVLLAIPLSHLHVHSVPSKVAPVTFESATAGSRTRCCQCVMDYNFPQRQLCYCVSLGCSAFEPQGELLSNYDPHACAVLLTCIHSPASTSPKIVADV